MKQKANKKKAAQGKKKSPGPGPVRPKTASSAMVTMGKPVSVHQVCSLTDPFCGAAQGAKWPGGGATRTLAIPFHSRATISSDVNGAGAMLFTPNYSFNGFGGSVSGGVVSYTSGGQFLSGVPSATSVRLVSYGFIIRCTLSPMTVTGMLRIRGFPSQYTTLGSIPVSSYNCSFYEDIPLRNVSEVCVVPRRYDVIRTQDFVPPSVLSPTAVLTAQTSNGWEVVQIAVEGAPASTVAVDVEMFYNFEMTFDDTDAYALVATPAVSNQQLASSSLQASSQLAPVAKAGKSAFHAITTAVAVRAIEAATTAVVSFVAGPGVGKVAGRASGMALTSYAHNVD